MNYRKHIFPIPVESHLKQRLCYGDDFYGVIYLVDFGDKVYVGQCSKNLKERFRQHKKDKKCNKLYNAYQKYKKPLMSSVIDYADNQEDLDKKEVMYIEKFSSIKNGYNIRGGGRNGTISEETKEKLRILNTGKVISKETREKIQNSLKKQSRPVVGTKEDGSCIEFVSINAAAKKLGADSGTISKICNGIKTHRHKGFFWRFK